MDNITVLSSAETIPRTAAVLAAIAKNPELYDLIKSCFPGMQELQEVDDEHKTAFTAAAGGDPEMLKRLKAVRQKLDRKETPSRGKRSRALSPSIAVDQFSVCAFASLSHFTPKLKDFGRDLSTFPETRRIRSKIRQVFKKLDRLEAESVDFSKNLMD